MTRDEHIAAARRCLHVAKQMALGGRKGDSDDAFEQAKRHAAAAGQMAERAQ